MGRVFQVPFAPDRQSAAPTTPKQGQQQQQQDAPSGRGSSFFAGPSPDGDNSFSHIDYVANYVADSMAGGGEAGKPSGGPSFWDGSLGGGSGSDAYDKQRDERAPISVLPASPAWSADDDVNRGTGVRRRVSPRAAAGGAAHGAGGMSPRAAGGMSPRAGGGMSPRAAGMLSPRGAAGGGADGGGARSPRRPSAGWAQPMVSPRRRDHGSGSVGGSGGGGNQHELRPLALAFSEDGGAAGGTAAAGPAGAPRRQGTRELRIDVGDAEEEQRRTFVGGRAGPAVGAYAGAAPPASPMNNARARAATPLAGGAGAREAGKKKVAAAWAAAAAAAEEAAAAAEAAGAEAAAVTESTVHPVGLRCSSPLYDRGRNMLGSAGGGGGGGDREGDGQAAPTLPPTERRGGGAAGEMYTFVCTAVVALGSRIITLAVFWWRKSTSNSKRWSVERVLQRAGAVVGRRCGRCDVHRSKIARHVGRRIRGKVGAPPPLFLRQGQAS